MKLILRKCTEDKLGGKPSVMSLAFFFKLTEKKHIKIASLICKVYGPKCKSSQKRRWYSPYKIN